MPGPWPYSANKQVTWSSPATNKLCFRITKTKQKKKYPNVGIITITSLFSQFVKSNIEL